jgi:hypothetical protein
MRIVAPWYSPVLPNGVVDELCAVEKALDSCPQTDSLHDPVASATSSFDLLRRGAHSLCIDPAGGVSSGRLFSTVDGGWLDILKAVEGRSCHLCSSASIRGARLVLLG